MEEEITEQIEYLSNHLNNVEHSANIKAELLGRIDRLEQLRDDLIYRF